MVGGEVQDGIQGGQLLVGHGLDQQLDVVVLALQFLVLKHMSHITGDKQLTVLAFKGARFHSDLERDHVVFFVLGGRRIFHLVREVSLASLTRVKDVQHADFPGIFVFLVKLQMCFLEFAEADFFKYFGGQERVDAHYVAGENFLEFRVDKRGIRQFYLLRLGSFFIERASRVIRCHVFIYWVDRAFFHDEGGLGERVENSLEIVLLLLDVELLIEGLFEAGSLVVADQHAHRDGFNAKENVLRGTEVVLSVGHEVLNTIHQTRNLAHGKDKVLHQCFFVEKIVGQDAHYGTQGHVKRHSEVHNGPKGWSAHVHHRELVRQHFPYQSVFLRSMMETMLQQNMIAYCKRTPLCPQTILW